MASHVQSFMKGAKGLKLKELAPYASKYSKEHLTYSKLQPQLKHSLDVSNPHNSCLENKPCTRVQLQGQRELRPSIIVHKLTLRRIIISRCLM
jgi:hypothetical protein